MGAGSVYFGCRLARVASFGATGWRDEAAYLADFFARHADLLSALVRQAGADAVWDLRFVTAPPVDAQEEMSVAVYLLGRLPAAAAGERKRLLQSLVTLLHATFPELDFEELQPAELDAARQPFKIGEVVGIRRRCLAVQLDTVSWRGSLPGGRQVGFSPPAAPGGGRPAPTLFHVCPFSPRLRPHDTLLEVLRSEGTPIAVSIRFASTELLAAELELLARQVGLCERYAQVSIGGGAREDLESLMPTLQQQARHHHDQQTRFLFGLRPGAALLTVEVASQRPLSSLTVAAVGGMVSAPPGSPDVLRPSPPLPYLAGGYEPYAPGAGAAERFATLDIDLPPVAGAPPGGERLAFLFDPHETAAAFRFPAASDSLPAGLEVRGWRLQPAPARLPKDGVVLGRSLGHGLPGRMVHLGSDDRLRHLYSIGQTGTGKSSLLRSMLLSDIEGGQGVCLIDPHGDLFGEILENIPPERAKDVVVVDPTDTDWPVGLNLLEYDSEDQRHFLVQELLGILRRLIADEYGTHNQGDFAGPVFYQHVRMNLLLAMSRPDDPGTLVEFHAIFNSPDYWERWIPLASKDPQLDFWASQVLTRTDYLRQPTDGGSALGPYISSKFDPFVFDPMLRLLFGQKRSKIRLDRIMDEGKILLVNLSKGLLTETNARFLGMVLLAKLQAATMARARRKRTDRRPFFVYVDEFQSLATSSFVGLLSEARKFGVGMVLANQFLTQIESEQIVQSILGNAGTLVCFRLGQPDAKAMEPRLAPAFSASDLQNLPNFHACVALLARGEALRPFSMRTLYRGADNPDGDRIRCDIVARSREQYARPRKEVEEEIGRSLGMPKE